MDAKIKLVVDEKEYHVKLMQAQEDLEKVKSEAVAVKQEIGTWNAQIEDFSQIVRVLAETFGSEMVGAYDGLIGEALKYSAVTEDNIKALTSYITTKGVTIEQIQNSINALDEETAKLGINTESWKKGMTASANLKAALSGVITQQTGISSSAQIGTHGVNSMRMAMTQLGYALNDSQMLLLNFRMGLMGISNNVPMIVQAFTDARAAAAATGTTIKDQLTAALMGGGGLVIAINAAMLLMNLLPGLLDKTKNKIKELTESLGDEEKKVRTQQIEFNSLIKILDDTTATEEARKGALKKLKEEYPAYVEFLKTERASHEKIAAALKLGNEQFEKKIQLAASTRILKEYYDQAATAEYEIQKLAEKRKTAQKQFDEGNKARGFSLFAIDKDIADLEIKKNEAIKKVQEFNVAMSQISSGLIDSKNDKTEKKSGTPKDMAFENARKELELAQNHAIKMTELEGKSDVEILELKQQHLSERIELYKKYAGDVTALNYALIETLRMIEVEGQKASEKEQAERLNNALANRKERHDANRDDQKQLEQLRIDAISNANERALAELEKWYAEQKATELYNNEELSEAKLLIDQQYANKKKEILQDTFKFETEQIRIVTDFVKSGLTEISDLEKSGSEKMENILKQLYSRAVDLLISYITEFIVQKATELATHTSTELAKTAVTIEQTAIRRAVEAGSNIAGDAAEAAEGGGGGGLGGLLDFIFDGLKFLGNLFGFAKGGAIVGENGPELIAPIQSYIDVNRNLVVGTVMAVERSLANARLNSLQSLSGSAQIESLLKSNLEAIQNWQKELRFNFKVRGNDLKTAVDRVNSYYNKFEVK